MAGTMKQSPKKSSSAKVKQRTKSSSGGNSSNNSNSNNSVHQQHSSSGSNNSLPHNQLPSHSHAKQATPHSDSSGNDASGMGQAKEKASFKAYAGLSPRSVRTAWEQHDKQETEVTAEVYEKLAKDTTYKLWELVNNIKTYSRHSSGRVTYNLVNEVLKDSDVPPIVGANSQPWDKIEYDGAYFFNTDEVLDLREEYIKDVTMEQDNVPVLSTTWMAEADIAEDLIGMYNNICDAIFIGDDDCFNAAIDILRCNQHTPSLMKLLLTKSIEMLGFEYTEDTLDRSLDYLEALTHNDHISHSDLTLELCMLDQLFVNLLLGPPGYVHLKLLTASGETPVANMNGTVSDDQQQQQQQQLEVISPLFNQSMAMLENNLPAADDSNNSNSNATEELLRSIENIKDGADGIDINIKDEYEALFSMVQGLGKQDDAAVVGETSVTTGIAGEGFQVKTEFDPQAAYDDAAAASFIVQQSLESQQQQPQPQELSLPGAILSNDLLSTGPLVRGEVKVKHEQLPTLVDADPEENVSLQMSESSDGAEEVHNPNSTTLESENITTLICADRLVDRVCRVIGLYAGKWGFVEQECTFLLVERLQRYFQERKTTAIDWNWLSRILRGLWAVGEFAMRELLPYFYQIDSQAVPEWLVPYFSAAGIFLNGKSDIFFYEYLYDICGDSLGPFMLSYEQYIENRYLKYNRRRLTIIKASNCYKVVAKVVPHLLSTSYVPRSKKTSKKMMQAWFEEWQPKRLPAVVHPSQPPRSRIGFRFSGCRPLPLKTVNRSRNKAAPGAMATPAAATSTAELKPTVGQWKNGNVVVGKRKLLKPVTNEPPRQYVFCYGSCTM
ncbi:uncharacterized protein LOC131209598 [Anopheles bellator]|uniref:uncharacterized protein LOC131209598 n=1 Tax=Anopheles bellator TaxID=139047 RepID=UPI002648A125|nr:uncharacterized protein LOC131209598 [Anopheles bellator]